MNKLEEIQNLKASFESCRQTKKTPYPEELWQRALALTKNQSIITVAKQIGISVSRLRYKKNQMQASPAINFMEAPELLACFAKQLHLEIIFPNNTKCHVTVSSSLQELISAMKEFC